MKKNNNIFWVGYSDLMTSLFFIMLVLFVLTTAYLQNEKKATEKQLDKIKELQTAVKKLPQNYFEYQPEYKRFKLKKQIQFDRGKDDIKNEYVDYLIGVGNSINKLIDSLNLNPEYKNFDIKYLVIIEGMASIDSYKDNFNLSYQRALALYELWKKELKGIIFNPNYCEIQIAGSGTEGIREYSGDKEFMNQQFLIQIVPKMGKISDK
jgi:outer membrane protein OmpA-like peptidoglycan-associated protein